ncbi:MAG: ISNCY family transposase, partial [Caldilineaceae bacterium]|nr:ISNCY family transposase [Caldilineaceae bacterium]
MPQEFGVDGLVEQVQATFDELPDARTGKNTVYEMKDAALGAFSVFFTQSASFLAHQQEMERTKGCNNARSLFGV